jgi:GT2 family glycosyltransferase
VDLSIIIVNWNSAAYTVDSIASVLETTHGIDYEILVIDNASTDDSRTRLARPFARTRLLFSPDNVGFARANNLAFRASTGRHLLFLNPDTRVMEGAIARMLRVLQSSADIGAVGARLLNGDLTLQTSCVQRFPTILNQVLDIDWLRRRFPTLGLWGMAPLYVTDSPAPVDVQVVSGACLMMKRAVFERIGWFSTDYFLYTEDVDLCFKVREAGLRVCHVGDAQVVHYGGGSSAKESDGFADVVMRESIRRFLGKTRSARYARRYRRAMTAAAMLRILVLRAAGVLPRERARAGRALRKWHRILAWSRGRERWAEELGAGLERARA